MWCGKWGSKTIPSDKNEDELGKIKIENILPSKKAKGSKATTGNSDSSHSTKTGLSDYLKWMGGAAIVAILLSVGVCLGVANSAEAKKKKRHKPKKKMKKRPMKKLKKRESHLRRLLIRLDKE